MNLRNYIVLYVLQYERIILCQNRSIHEGFICHKQEKQKRNYKSWIWATAFCTFRAYVILPCLLPFLYSNLISGQTIPLTSCYVQQSFCLLEGYMLLEQQQTNSHKQRICYCRHPPLPLLARRCWEKVIKKKLYGYKSRNSKGPCGYPWWLQMDCRWRYIYSEGKVMLSPCRMV